MPTLPSIISDHHPAYSGYAFMRHALVLILMLLGTALGHAAAPVLVTPELPPATIGFAYQARLLIGASPAVTSSVLQGLPAGMSATYSGNNISVSGVPAAAGVFALTLNAANANGSLSKALSLTFVDTSAFASNVVEVSSGTYHTCAVVAGGCSAGELVSYSAITITAVMQA